MYEIWKDIPEYEGRYQISNYGNIRSLDRVQLVERGNGKTRRVFYKGKIIGQRISNTGYYRVRLRKNGIPQMFSIHRLVAQAFIPNPEDKPQVNHIDGNKLNNHVENLEWATASENTLHAFKTGLEHGLKGELSPNKKAVLQYNTNGTFVKRWSCGADAARYLNGNKSGIYNACRCINCKTYKGYIWRFEDE